MCCGGLRGIERGDIWNSIRGGWTTVFEKIFSSFGVLTIRRSALSNTSVQSLPSVFNLVEMWFQICYLFWHHCAFISVMCSPTMISTSNRDLRWPPSVTRGSVALLVFLTAQYRSSVTAIRRAPSATISNHIYLFFFSQKSKLLPSVPTECDRMLIAYFHHAGASAFIMLLHLIRIFPEIRHPSVLYRTVYRNTSPSALELQWTLRGSKQSWGVWSWWGVNIGRRRLLEFGFGTGPSVV